MLRPLLRHVAVRQGRRVAPLELVVVRGGAERRAVEERQLLGKLVQRVAQHRDAVRIKLGHDFDDVHLHGKSLGDLRRVGVVVFDERHVSRAHAVRDERVVVARQVGVGRKVLLGLPGEGTLNKDDGPGGLVRDDVVPFLAEVGVEPRLLVARLGVLETVALYLFGPHLLEFPGREGGVLHLDLLAADDPEERADVGERQGLDDEALVDDGGVVVLHLVRPVVVKFL